ncbi:MAG TPA: hypothetical protein VGQ83_20320 [Polyangia bacterium]
MRHLTPVALALLLLTLTGCPLFRPSASPEDACRAAAKTMARCATAAAPKWDDAQVASCVATLKGLAAAQATDKGFTAARLRDCDRLPDCAAAASCVTDALKYATEHGQPAPRGPRG